MGADFFQVISVRECLSRLKSFSPVSRTETLALALATERIAAQGIEAPEDLPPFSRSSMDGYAVRAADTFGASELQPVYLAATQAITMGRLPGFRLNPGECAPTATGAALPEGADAVVMVEHTAELGGGDIEVQRSLTPGENVLLQAEDCRRGELQVAAGSRLRPQQIGMLAALGLPWVEVFARPRVGIISTGDEIVPVEATPPPGCIRDVNTASLSGWISKTGGEPVAFEQVPDQPEALRTRLEQAMEACDLVLLSGGSSVGTRDLTLEILEALAPQGILAHGLALSPGKPTIVADVNGTPVFGLPGQVTSAQVVFAVVCQPFLRYLAGEAGYPDYVRPSLTAELSRNLPSALGRDDYVRVKLHRGSDGGLTAEPLLGKSGLLRTMLRADGLTCIPAHTEGFAQGRRVEVWLL